MKDWFVRHGYVVSTPETEDSRYDLIIDKDNSLSRVQVKMTTSFAASGNYTCDLRTMGGNKSGQTVKKISKKETDFVAVCCDVWGPLYLIPASQVDGQSTVTLSKAYDPFLVQSAVNFYIEEFYTDNDGTEWMKLKKPSGEKYEMLAGPMKSLGFKEGTFITINGS